MRTSVALGLGVWLMHAGFARGAGVTEVGVVPAQPAPFAQLQGGVDSSLVARAGAHAVYLLASHDDGAAPRVLAEAAVRQVPGTCAWSYRFPPLAAGRYALVLGRARDGARDAATAVAGAAHVAISLAAGAAARHDFVPGRVLRVGPKRAYATPSAASRAVRDGDVVEIDAGVYDADVAVWRAHNLTLRGTGGRAHLRANGAAAEGKAVWVIKGRDVSVEHLEFSGAAVADRNGAGIRQEAPGLRVCGSYFHDNQNGILGGGGDMLVEYSEFARNGAGDGYSHNLYIVNTERFTLRGSYVHHARVGHNVKSRAKENHILYNRIMDEVDGNSSYAIDVPDGGTAYVIGNVIQQGLRSENRRIVSYAAERPAAPGDRFYFINNTVVNEQDQGTFVALRPGSQAVVANNLFVGFGQTGVGDTQQRNNLATRALGFVDAAHYDYRLQADSPARDAGADPGTVGGVSLRPVWQYRHPAALERRPSAGALDVGAYEFGS